MNLNSTHLRRITVGTIIGAAWIAGLVVAEPVVGEFAITAIAQEIIFQSPGWLATTAIDLLGFYARPALVASVIVAALAVTSFTALVWPQNAEFATPVAIIIGVVVTTGLYFAVGTGLSVEFFGGLVIAIVPPYLVARVLTNAPAATDQTDRRWFLRRVGGVTAAGAVSVVGLRVLFDRFAPDEAERAGESLERSVSPPTGDPEFDFDGMSAAVTSIEDHYNVDISVSNPTIDPESWTLDIDGEVEQPYSLSYDELLDHDEHVEQTTTMLCISNEIGGDLIGTAHWTGVQLMDLIEAAEPTDEAVDIVTYADDGYSEAIPLELVEREDILIAYGMGDRTLPVAHGFPARLLVPGRYGMKMTKWITRIEVASEEHEAHWEERGWNEEAVVNTMSYVRGAQRDGDQVMVGGVAFGGLETGVEEISGVEVSVDGGETWNEGELESQLAEHAWRRWRYVFEAPDQSEFDVVVRALERDGTVQTEEETDPTPHRATGWHRETIQV